MDSWRVAVLGDGGVGKTALAVQFTLNCFVATLYASPYFPETYDPTIEDAYRKQMVVDNRMCFVEVIDTAGQEEYVALRDQWIREGQGFLLVYSIASRVTFERLEVFRQSILRVKRPKPVFILVGNKCDRSQDREVTREEGIEMARYFGCDFLETSAKTAVNVERLFSSLVRKLRESRQENGGPSTGLVGPSGTAPLPGAPPPQGQKKKRNNRCIIV